ncbi:YciI family protein [Nocardioides antri]|nr:YciI family protein [Nocardioides antri]
MVLVKMGPEVGAPPAELSEAMGREMGEAFASGLMVDAGGLSPVSAATEIRLSAGRVTVTDGPFAEAKEVVGGYSILETSTKEEAVEAARRVIELHQEFWPGWEGSVEVRGIAGSDQAPPAAP